MMKSKDKQEMMENKQERQGKDRKNGTTVEMLEAFLKRVERINIDKNVKE